LRLRSLRHLDVSGFPVPGGRRRFIILALLEALVIAPALKSGNAPSMRLCRAISLTIDFLRSCSR